MIEQLKVAIAQMDIALGDPQANLVKVRQYAEQSVAQHADILVLPELWSSGYALERANELADPPEQGLLAEIAAIAGAYQIAIVGSTLVQRAGQPTNTATIYGAEGTLLAEYSKIHLFGLMQEDQYLAPGRSAPVFDLPWGRSALAICYDLRFPELFRSYAVQGAGLIIVPSEWPHPRLEHWQILVRARAIENQCFVVACNRVGADRNNRFCGHSQVVDPWGTVIAHADEEPCLLLATLELRTIVEVRNRIPVFQDRQPHLYAL